MVGGAVTGAVEGTAGAGKGMADGVQTDPRSKIKFNNYSS